MIDLECARLEREFLADPSNEALAQLLWRNVQRTRPVIDGQSLEHWFGLLDSDDETGPYEAVKVLKRLGPSLLWPALEKLESDKSRTRALALFLLEGLGPTVCLALPRAKQLILNPIEDYSAARVIASVDSQEAFDFLYELVGAKDNPILSDAALKGFAGNKRHGPKILASFLSHERLTIVRSAITALGSMGVAAESEVPKLIPFLNSQDSKLKKLSKEALKLIVSPTKTIGLV